MKSVALRPPAKAETQPLSADDWTLDLDELNDAISPRTKMLVCCFQAKPDYPGEAYSFSLSTHRRAFPLK